MMPTNNVIKDAWQCGFVLYGSAGMTADKEAYDINLAYERKRVYRDFTPNDRGRSRKLIAVFENEDDALIATESVNNTQWRAVNQSCLDLLEILPKTNWFPMQIWAPDFKCVRLVKNIKELKKSGATHWAPVLRPPA